MSNYVGVIGTGILGMRKRNYGYKINEVKPRLESLRGLSSSL